MQLEKALLTVVQQGQAVGQVTALPVISTNRERWEQRVRWLGQYVSIVDIVTQVEHKANSRPLSKMLPAWGVRSTCVLRSHGLKQFLITSNSTDDSKHAWDPKVLSTGHSKFSTIVMKMIPAEAHNSLLLRAWGERYIQGPTQPCHVSGGATTTKGLECGARRHKKCRTMVVKRIPAEAHNSLLLRGGGVRHIQGPTQPCHVSGGATTTKGLECGARRHKKCRTMVVKRIPAEAHNSLLLRGGGVRHIPGPTQPCHVSGGATTSKGLECGARRHKKCRTMVVKRIPAEAHNSLLLRGGGVRHIPGPTQPCHVSGGATTSKGLECVQCDARCHKKCSSLARKEAVTCLRLNSSVFNQCNSSAGGRERSSVCGNGFRLYQYRAICNASSSPCHLDCTQLPATTVTS